MIENTLPWHLWLCQVDKIIYISWYVLSLRHCLHGCTYLLMLLFCVCNLTVKIFASNPTNGLISDALDKGQFVTFRSFTETQNSSRLKSKDLPCLECCPVVFECMVLSQAANLTIPRKFWPTTDTSVAVSVRFSWQRKRRLGLRDLHRVLAYRKWFWMAVTDSMSTVWQPVLTLTLRTLTLALAASWWNESPTIRW